MDAQLQAAILNHINAVIGVTGSEKSLSLVKMDQHHVTTQLQEERFFEMAENPKCKQHSCITANAHDNQDASMNGHKMQGYLCFILCFTQRVQLSLQVGLNEL